MTMKLSELRVSATMNAAPYKAGMDQKVAADNAGSASSQKFGAAIGQTYQKVSQAGSVVERLSKQYIAGYAEAFKFESALRALGRGMETGNVSLAQASAILDGLYKKFGMAAESTQIQSAGYTKLADTVAQKNAEIARSGKLVTIAGAEVAAGMSLIGRQALDVANQNNRIAAGFASLGQSSKVLTPAVKDVAAGMSTYGKATLEASVQNERLITGMSRFGGVARGTKATLADIVSGMSSVGRQSLIVSEQNDKIAAGFARIGQLSKAQAPAVTDVAAGMSTYGKAALTTSIQNERLISGMSRFGGVARQTAGAIAETGKGAALTTYQLANLSFQINDVVTMAALGARPLQILASQGGQVFQILQQGEGGVRASLSYLGQLITGLITPFRLAVSGATALAAAGVYLGVSWRNAQQQISLALTGVGGAAGVTAGDINAVSLAVAAAGELSVSEAREIALAMASTGKVSSDVISRVTALGHSVELVFGTDAKGAAELLAGALADPAKGVEDLNKRLLAFDDATSQSIKNLTTQNRLFDAQTLFVNGLEKSIGKASDQTTLWGYAYDTAAAKASYFFGVIGQGVNRAAGFQDPKEALEDAQTKLDQMVSSKTGALVGGRIPQRFSTSQIDAQIEKVRQFAEAYSKIADNDQEAARVRESLDFGNMVRNIDPSLSKLAELDATLKRLKDDLLNNEVTSRIDDDTFAAGIHAVSALEARVALEKEYIALAFQEKGISSSTLGQALKENAVVLAGIDARTPAQKADIAYQQAFNSLRQQGISVAESMFRADMARAQSLNQSQHDLSEAARDRMYQSRQDIEQGELQNSLIGRSVEVSTRLTAQFQLLAAAKAEAFKNGTTVSVQEQLQALIAADEKARQAVDAARKNVSNDLTFSNDQLGWTPIEQNVYSTMQSAGLLDNGKIVGAQNEMIAAQIRFNEELQRSMDIQKGFASDFLHTMLQGKSATEALGNALNNLASKILDNSLDTLFAGLKGVGGTSSGGLFGGNILPGILHAGGVAGNDNYPTRSVSPLAFVGAPRYHSGGIAGFKPDEVPAILQRGEVVLPRGASASGNGGVTVNVPVSIDATGADAAGLARVTQAVAQLQATLPSTIIKVVHGARDRRTA